MKKTSIMILGFIGGVAGLLGATFGYFVGNISSAFGGGSDLIIASLIAVILSIMGIVGGVIAKSNTRTSGYLMLIAGIEGLIAISIGYFIAGPLLIVGGILSLQEAKKEKIPFDKKKFYIWLGVGIAILIILMLGYSSNSKPKNGSGTVLNNTTNTNQAINNENKKSCPDIIKTASKYDFFWSKSDAGYDTLYLYADFILDMQFNDDFLLANKPNISDFMRDYVACKKGSETGESINKLYCKPIYIYEPMLEKKNIDKDGNVISTDDKYLKAFIFDIQGKDLKNVNDLKSLKMESITCSDSWL